MNLEKRVKEIREEAQSRNDKLNKLDGQKESVLAQLKAKGLKNKSDLKSTMGKLEKEIEEGREKLESELDKLESEYGL